MKMALYLSVAAITVIVPVIGIGILTAMFFGPDSIAHWLVGGAVGAAWALWGFLPLWKRNFYIYPVTPIFPVDPLTPRVANSIPRSAITSLIGIRRTNTEKGD